MVGQHGLCLGGGGYAAQPKFSEMQKVGPTQAEFTDWTEGIVIRWQWREKGQPPLEDSPTPTGWVYVVQVDLGERLLDRWWPEYDLVAR